PESAKVVLFCGRISEEKGVDILIEAFERVARKDPSTFLLICGRIQDPATANRLLVRIMPYSCQNRARLLGPVAPALMPSIYACADVFVLPSISGETQGLVVV